MSKPTESQYLGQSWLTVSEEVEDDGIGHVEEQRHHHREHSDAEQEAQQTQASGEQKEH